MTETETETGVTQVVRGVATRAAGTVPATLPAPTAPVSVAQATTHPSPMMRRVASLDTMQRVQAVEEFDYTSDIRSTTGGGVSSGGNIVEIAGGAGVAAQDPVNSFFQLLGSRLSPVEHESGQPVDSAAITTAVNEGVQRGIRAALGYMGNM